MLIFVFYILCTLVRFRAVAIRLKVLLLSLGMFLYCFFACMKLTALFDRGMPPMPLPLGMMPPASGGMTGSATRPPLPPSTEPASSVPKTNPGQLLFPAAASLTQVCTQ